MPFLTTKKRFADDKTRQAIDDLALYSQPGTVWGAIGSWLKSIGTKRSYRLAG